VIGPVNYLVLKRRQRLYLLIGTVPVLAVCSTVILVGYALASDGFITRTRVRSVTLLDQEGGEAVSWSRISYYTGLPPSGGLRFSSDTAVYPIPPEGSNREHRSVQWGEDQHLASGWLRSRTPTQLFTVGYRQTEESLGIETDAGGAVYVRNRLGAPIRCLLLADAQGVIHAAGAIEREARNRLTVQELDLARAELRELVDSQRLELPAELLNRAAGGWVFSRRRYAPWNRWQSSDSQESLMELGLAALSGEASELATLLQPRTYVAVTERLPSVELGLPRCQDHGSLYVVVGAF
jgi:hypothetical protein